MRRKARALRCWSCWGQAQRGFHPFDSYGLVLICKAVTPVLFRKDSTHSTRSWNGYRASPLQHECPGTTDAAVGKRALVSLPGFVVASPNPCVLHLATGLDSTACKIKKIITGETERMGPKSGSGKVGYGMLKLACQAGILKAGPWNHVICKFRNEFSRRGEDR